MICSFFGSYISLDGEEISWDFGDFAGQSPLFFTQLHNAMQIQSTREDLITKILVNNAP